MNANDVHLHDPRIAARLAAEGYPWETLANMSPYEMPLTLGMASINRLESKLDLVNLMVTLQTESKDIDESYLRTGRRVAQKGILGTRTSSGHVSHRSWTSTFYDHH